MFTAFAPLIAAAIDAQKPLVASFALIVVLVLLSKVPLSYNLLNVLVRWRTTTLTCLAFMLVTGLLIWMLAFVNGMYVLTENSGVPGNLIVLSEGPRTKRSATSASPTWAISKTNKACCARTTDSSPAARRIWS